MECGEGAEAGPAGQAMGTQGVQLPADSVHRAEGQRKAKRGTVTVTPLHPRSEQKDMGGLSLRPAFRVCCGVLQPRAQERTHRRRWTKRCPLPRLCHTQNCPEATELGGILSNSRAAASWQAVLLLLDFELCLCCSPEEGGVGNTSGPRCGLSPSPSITPEPEVPSPWSQTSGV